MIASKAITGKVSTLITAACLLLMVAPAVGAQSSWPIFRGDSGLSGYSDAALPDNPRLLWSFETGDAITSTPVAEGGRVFVGSNDGKLYALSLTDGRELWHFDAGDAIEAPALIAEGTVYVGTLGGTLFALDAARGAIRWQRETDAVSYTHLTLPTN